MFCFLVTKSHPSSPLSGHLHIIIFCSFLLSKVYPVYNLQIQSHHHHWSVFESQSRNHCRYPHLPQRLQAIVIIATLLLRASVYSPRNGEEGKGKGCFHNIHLIAITITIVEDRLI